MCTSVDASSPLDSLVRTGTTVEIVFDNAISHADFAVILNTLESRIMTKRRRWRGLQLRPDYCNDGNSEEGDREIKLDDLRTFMPNLDYMHSSFPGRNETFGHKEVLCRWASSSDSDFAHVPSHRSFDRMLKEASSGTTSARANVPRPVRRTSLKASSQCLDSDEKVLNNLCSNLLGSFTINARW